MPLPARVYWQVLWDRHWRLCPNSVSTLRCLHRPRGQLHLRLRRHRVHGRPMSDQHWRVSDVTVSTWKMQRYNRRLYLYMWCDFLRQELLKTEPLSVRCKFRNNFELFYWYWQTLHLRSILVSRTATYYPQNHASHNNILLERILIIIIDNHKFEP